MVPQIGRLPQRWTVLHQGWATHRKMVGIEKQVEMDAAPLFRPDPQADIDLPVIQSYWFTGGDQFQVDAGVQFAERTQLRQQPLHGQGREGEDGQAGGDAAAAQFAGRVVDAVEGVGQRVGVGFALRGQDDAARIARE